MPGVLHVDFAAVRQIGTDLTTEAANVRNTLATLKSRANPDTIFQGFTAEAYWEFYNNWDARQEGLLTILDQLGQMLQAFTNAMESGDSDQASRILSGL